MNSRGLSSWAMACICQALYLATGCVGDDSPSHPAVPSGSYTLLEFLPTRFSASSTAYMWPESSEGKTYYHLRLDAWQDGLLMQVQSRGATMRELLSMGMAIAPSETPFVTWFHNFILVESINGIQALEEVQRYQIDEGIMEVDQFDPIGEVLSGRIVEAKWSLFGQMPEPPPEGATLLPAKILIQDISFYVHDFDSWANTCDPDCE